MADGHGVGRRQAGTRAYIGSFTSAGGPGVVIADRDPETGALTVVAAADDVPDPSYLTLAPEGGLLYAVSERPEGAVAAFDVSGDAPRLTGPPLQTGADGPTHLALHAGHLLTADYGSGTVTAVPLRPDGTPADAPSGVLRHTGSGPNRDRQQSPHAHQVQPDPSGRWAVGVDLGTDSVLVYTLAEGVLVLHGRTALRPGSGPRHLAFRPGGSHAYVAHELAPVVTVCRWDAGAGSLEPLHEVRLLSDVPKGDAYPSGLAVSADGRHVWVAVRGEDVISVLAVDGDGEKPDLVATVPCGGHWPRALAAAEGHLYVANERSGDVTWFSVDPGTGEPRRGGSIRVPAASCVVLGP